ncbi:hypothetical protein D3C76_1668430 [compost metagenome]
MVDQRRQPQTNRRDNNRDGAGSDRQHVVGGETEPDETCRFVDWPPEIDSGRRRHADGVHHRAGLACGEQQGAHTGI